MVFLPLLGLILVCFASICVISFREFSRHQLEELCEWWKVKEHLGIIIKNYERTAIAAETFRVISVIFTFIVAVAFLPPYLPSFQPTAETSKISWYAEWAVFIFFAAVATMLCVIWIPHAIAKLWATIVVFYTYSFWSLLTLLFYPLELVHHFFATLFCRLAGYVPDTTDEQQFEEEIRTIVTEGHREGLLEEDAREMIESVIELGDVTVSEIMTPRTDTVCISRTLSWDEMIEKIITIPHSRIPVYNDNRDDIVGILFVKDLIAELAKEKNDRVPWTDLLRAPLFVPETKPVDKLLQEFQKTTHLQAGRRSGPHLQYRHMHIAIVLDEYGGMSGLVSLEDILEEIVGEIIDEHDPITNVDDIRQLSSGVFEVLGKVHLDELNDRLDVDFPEEEDYDTIGGYIFSTLGHIPLVGEMVLYKKDNKEYKLTVLEATKRRIERVLIERVQDEPGA